jgi:hypothetical protein
MYEWHEIVNNNNEKKVLTLSYQNDIFLYYIVLDFQASAMLIQVLG